MSIYVPTINIVFEPETQTGSNAHEPYSTLSLRVAEIVKEQIAAKPDSCLALPTGRTPTGSYQLLSSWSRQGTVDWSRVRTFGLDEYYDVDDSVSFAGYLETNLYCNTNLPATSRFNPLLANNYDALIRQAGELDLTILGIGKNGHIAFNEPGTSLHSWTHSIFLTESTREANAEFFKHGQIPTRAVTVGIQTILASKRIILMVSGAQKKEILVRSLKGPINEAVPASFLQLHKNVLVMTDFPM
jgi:glucosamine-6-phosphate deaminase